MKNRPHGRAALGSLRSRYDALLRYMQMPKARKGMEAAFNASPTDLGRIAVRATNQKSG